MKTTFAALAALLLLAPPALAVDNPFAALGKDFEALTQDISYDCESEMEINGQVMKTKTKMMIKDKDTMRIETTMEGNPAGDSIMVMTKDKTYTYLKANNMLMESPRPPAPAEVKAPEAEAVKPVESEEDGMIRLSYKTPDGSESIMWLAKDTRFPVKNEVRKDGKTIMKMTYSNVRKGDPGDLLKFPDGAKRTEMPALPAVPAAPGAGAKGDDGGGDE